MNLNQSVRLSELPKVSLGRSKFDRSHKHTTTFNIGRLVPIYIGEALPGSTIKIDTSCVVRLQTLLRPLMDNLYLDTYFFSVPLRVVWDNFPQFMGENKDSAWLPTVQHFKPMLTASSNGFSEGSIADYFGLPTKVGGISVDALPFRAYASIVDYFFRDENLQTPIVITKDDTSYTAMDSTDANYDDQISCLQLGGAPFIAGKYHDRFSSSLPYPQKHSDVFLPLSGYVPVVPLNAPWSDDELKHGDTSQGVGFGMINAMQFKKLYGNSTQSSKTGNLSSPYPIGTDGTWGTLGSTSSSFNTSNYPIITNLGANLDYGVSASINDLRMSLAMQKLYERDALYGTRFQEQLLGQFGIRTADARLQMPEFLGGDHIPLNISQVVNVAQSSNPLGNVGGYSLTGRVHKDVLASFQEWSLIIGVAVCRYEHSYQQGINRLWLREDRLDYYYPVMAEISNQPIFKKEICATGTSTDDEVFGYQEAWFDYRYGDYNHVTGQMRSNVTGTLDSFHLADYYATPPTLSASWIREDVNIPDRVLAVTHNVSDQILADFYFKEDAVLPMPVYSIPSLEDHFVR